LELSWLPFAFKVLCLHCLSVFESLFIVWIKCLLQFFLLLLLLFFLLLLQL
jgi:hypothetical protein